MFLIQIISGHWNKFKSNTNTTGTIGKINVGIKQKSVLGYFFLS